MPICIYVTWEGFLLTALVVSFALNGLTLWLLTKSKPLKGSASKQSDSGVKVNLQVNTNPA
jgi:multisubunit Na+/H+ antiporter MnhC subunit